MSDYKGFWDWFSFNQKEIFLNIEKDIDHWVPLISQKLSEIDENIAFEISERLEDDIRQFIISADGIFDSFQIVVDLYNSKPELEFWQFIPFRQRENMITHSVNIDGILLAYENIKFTYEVIDSMVYLDIYIQGYTVDDNRYVHAYFLLLDSLIGEFDAVTMIENTNVHPFEESEDLLDFYSLKAIIDDLK